MSVNMQTFLQEHGTLCAEGSINAALLFIHPHQAKTKITARAPVMRSTKKGNSGHFGMTAPMGVDAHGGLSHTAGISTTTHHPKVTDTVNRLKSAK